MTPPSLAGRNLVHIYGSGDNETQALRGVSLDLAPGALTLVMGPSGCGKTTLLAVLSGLLPPTRGQVLVEGRDLYAQSAAARRDYRRQHVGFIFQGFCLFPTLTVREQLELVLRWGENLTADEAQRRTTELLAVLNLARKEGLFPAQLSGGEQQRVAVGRALIKHPSLIFADEPTSALDWDHGRQVMEILARAAHEESATVLAVSHDARVMPYADHIVELDDGAVKTPAAGAAPKGRKELVHS